ncbi:zinc finger MYM-type protein 1-like protein [Tanacetum coccineum]
MSLILRYVNEASTCVTVEESFLGFLSVDDMTSQGLFDVTHDELKSLDLDIDDVHGQRYDNGSNMKGKHRGESHVKSVKAIRYQLLKIREALLQVTETDNDSKIKSESKSLATNELGDFEFLVSTVIWFDILSAINLVSKKLQTDDKLIDVAIKEVKGLTVGFRDIDPIFCQKRVIHRKRQFDENSVDQDTSYFVEESFKVQYFLYIVDQALVSLRTRFEQYKDHLEAALKNNKQSDVDAKDLFCGVELEVFDEIAHVVVVMFDEPATSLTKCSAESIMEVEDESSDDHESLPPAIANLFGTTHILEIKYHTYYEYGNFESF